jgi:hypothetical protein
MRQVRPTVDALEQAEAERARKQGAGMPGVDHHFREGAAVATTQVGPRPACRHRRWCRDGSRRERGLLGARPGVGAAAVVAQGEAADRRGNEVPAAGPRWSTPANALSMGARWADQRSESPNPPGRLDEK